VQPRFPHQKRISGSGNLADSPPNPAGALARLRPPPTPQLNLRREDDHHGVHLVWRNPQQTMRQTTPGLAATTSGAGLRVEKL